MESALDAGSRRREPPDGAAEVPWPEGAPGLDVHSDWVTKRIRPALVKTSGRQVRHASSPAWVQLRAWTSGEVTSDCRGPSRVSMPPDRGDRPSRFDESIRQRTLVVLPLPDRSTPGPSLQGSVPLQPLSGDHGRFRMSVVAHLPDSGWMPIARTPSGARPESRPSHRTAFEAGSSVESVDDCIVDAVV